MAGIGVASVVNLLDIELVVIGGGLVSAGDLLLGPTRESFGRFLFGSAQRPLPQIVPARFGPDAGVVGAAALALDHNDLHRPAPAATPIPQAIQERTPARCQTPALPKCGIRIPAMFTKILFEPESGEKAGDIGGRLRRGTAGQAARRRHDPGRRRVRPAGPGRGQVAHGLALPAAERLAVDHRTRQPLLCPRRRYLTRFNE